MLLLICIFSGLMLLLFFLSLYVPRFAHVGSELVSLGVLGTFIGVFIGLYQFDFNAIEASMPGLLEGLKTAFVTSIIGLSLYIVLMLLKSVRGAEDGTPPEITPALQAQMLAVLESGFEYMRTNADQTIAIQKETLRTLDNAFSSISQQSQQEIVNALAEVVKDFNAQLNTQFGDNFRQLNASVAALNAWQANYQSYVTEMEHSLHIVLRELNETLMLINQQTLTSGSMISKMDQSSEKLNQQLNTSVNIVKESLDLLLRKANAHY